MRIFRGLLLLPFLLLSANPADACTCIVSGLDARADVQKQFGRAKAIFEGKVQAIDEIAADPSGSIRYVGVRFLVLHRYKGAEGDSLVVLTAADGAACGYSFKTGEKYLVYAYQDSQDRLQTSYCTRTAILKEAGTDRRYLKVLAKEREKKRREALGPDQVGIVLIEGPADVVDPPAAFEPHHGEARQVALAVGSDHVTIENGVLPGRFLRLKRHLFGAEHRAVRDHQLVECLKGNLLAVLRGELLVGGAQLAAAQSLQVSARDACRPRAEAQQRSGVLYADQHPSDQRKGQPAGQQEHAQAPQEGAAP